MQESDASLCDYPLLNFSSCMTIVYHTYQCDQLVLIT